MRELAGATSSLAQAYAMVYLKPRFLCQVATIRLLLPSLRWMIFGAYHPRSLAKTDAGAKSLIAERSRSLVKKASISDIAKIRAG
jgi:hypothetical protein